MKTEKNDNLLLVSSNETTEELIACKDAGPLHPPGKIKWARE